MKNIDKYIRQLNYTSSPDYFKVRGRLLHWTILLPLGTWVTFGISLLFEGEFITWIVSGLIALGLGVLLSLAFWFEIIINRDNVVIKLLFGFIPFRIIKSSTIDLIIDHKDAEQLTLISQRKDYYSEDVKNNLRFDYIVPWDGDDYEFYVDYRNKEIDLTVGCQDELWTKLIEGLKMLEKNTITKA